MSDNFLIYIYGINDSSGLQVRWKMMHITISGKARNGKIFSAAIYYHITCKESKISTFLTAIIFFGTVEGKSLTCHPNLCSPHWKLSERKMKEIYEEVEANTEQQKWEIALCCFHGHLKMLSVFLQRLRG